MTINIKKIDDTEVAVNNTATLVFRVNEFPGYKLLHTQVNQGTAAKPIQNETSVIIKVSEVDNGSPIVGSIYLYYITDTSV